MMVMVVVRKVITNLINLNAICGSHRTASKTNTIATKLIIYFTSFIMNKYGMEEITSPINRLSVIIKSSASVLIT